MIELPETFTTDIYLTTSSCDVLCVFGTDMTCHGYTTLMTKEVTFQMPKNINLNALKLNSLEKQRAEFIKETTQRLNDIDDQIATLKCLESLK